MDTKLTLKLDDKVIRRAKLYAKKNNISLSKLIESYLSALTSKAKSEKQIEVSPLVRSLTGVAEDKGIDFKKDYTDYLNKKYK